MDSRLSAYRRTETLGKSQLDLILQVYDGAVNAYTSAREHFEREEFQSGREALDKAKRFVTHLYTTLDFEKGEEIAQNLGRIYAFVISETDAVQGTKNTKQLDAVISILGNIRSGWAGLGESNTEKQPTSGNRSPEPDKFVTVG